MKQYKVTLKDNREVFVKADSHKLEGTERVFFEGDAAITDVLVRDAEVIAITIDDEDTNYSATVVY